MNKLLDLFLTFARIGGLTFGGGYAMLPMLQREVVEKRGWASEEELMDYYAIGQCTPGIIAVNTATFVGQRTAGIAGGIIATLGVVFPSLIIITVIAAFIQNFQYIRKLLKALSAPDIYSKSCFIHLRTWHRQKFCKFRNQWDRQIIHTKISHIFQHLKCRTFSGTGHSSHNYKSPLIRPLIASLPVPDPRRNSPSRGSVPVSSVP